MRFSDAIDVFIRDMRLEGRINSVATERDYRGTLGKHSEDVANRDPRYVGRDDVKRTLARWPHPNSQRKNRSILISFYDWLVQEGERPHNPARQTRSPRPRAPETYRLSRAEVVRLLGAVRSERERRAIFIGLCAGLRRQELLGLQGRHSNRDGFLWVSADIAKGQRERWVPVVASLRRSWPTFVGRLSRMITCCLRSGGAIRE